MLDINNSILLVKMLIPDINIQFLLVKMLMLDINNSIFTS